MASKFHKPGEWEQIAAARSHKHQPRTANPHSGPMLSNMVTGLGTRGHLTDSRGNKYRSALSGNEKKGG